MSPAVEMAEIQQIELSVVLRVVDGVNILKQKNTREVRGKLTDRTGRRIRDSYIKMILGCFFNCAKGKRGKFKAQQTEKLLYSVYSVLTHCTSSLQPIPL